MFPTLFPSFLNGLVRTKDWSDPETGSFFRQFFKGYGPVFAISIYAYYSTVGKGVRSSY